MPVPPMNPLLALGIATAAALFLALAKWSLRALRRKLLALSAAWALAFWFLRDRLPSEIVEAPAAEYAIPALLGAPAALAVLEGASAAWHYRGRVLGRLRSSSPR